MADESEEYAQKVHAQHMEERKILIDAARESSRTFDQAVLAFGAAVFGASVAFLKDVAPKPQPYTIVWLGASWTCFVVGLLAVILSFLFSHDACMFQIDAGEHLMRHPDAEPLRNRWATVTKWCNYLCVMFLFVGVAAWTVFALENLAAPGGKNDQPPSTAVGCNTKGARPAEGGPTAAPTNPANPSTTARKEVK
jgi:hypothetical protein